ncbi:MAG: metal ABC transporter permease [Myxococcales bacterium]|nr:metal ABC transporter permease [Myxococcales bacterium]
MELLTEPFSHAFMVRALVCGLAVGAVCASLGVFVVQRGLSFVGDGLAHAAFGGIALGLLLDVSVAHAMWVALPFTFCTALGIAWVLRSGRVHGDVATGVFFGVTFALGVLLLGFRSPDRAIVSVESILFGSILAIGQEELVVVLATASVVGLALAACWSRLAYATFDAELARASGVPVARLDYLLLGLTAVVVVVSVQTVGVVLVSSFIIIPAATAGLLARTLRGVTLVAIALGTAGAAVGLVASYHLDVASGATIILTLGAIFFVALLTRRAHG